MGSAPWTDGSSYGIDLQPALDIIRKEGYRRVGLQVPEGLMRLAPSMARFIQEMAGSEVTISGDPCYGACDLDMALCHQVDLLIHVGHSRLLDRPQNVLYIEARMSPVGADLAMSLSQALPLLGSSRIGVVTTVQHLHLLDPVLDALKGMGAEPQVGPPGPRTPHPGQVLGCCYHAARSLDVEAYLFIGTGRFHPLGVALATAKRVVALDPVSGRLELMDPEPLIRRRMGVISRAMNAQCIAVIVSRKPGQMRQELAERLVEMGRAHGREMFLFQADRVEPDQLVNLGLDAAVSTACPRVALDDASRYAIPVLTPPEFEILLGVREDYHLDEIG